MAKQLHEKQQDLDLNIQNKHFVESPDGAVKWITSEQLLGGLRMYNYSITRNLQPSPDPTTFVHYDTADGIGSNLVNKVFVAGSTIYAATEGGLSISTDYGLTYTNYTTADGLGSNTVYDVYASGNTIYVGTHGGLSISTDAGVTYTNYTTADGLQDNICIAVYYDNGKIYVGNNSGISISTDGITFSVLTVSIVANYDIQAFGENIYVAGQFFVSGAFHWGLAVSNNSGASWTYHWLGTGLGSVVPTNPCTSVHVVSNTWVVGIDNYICISNDYGATWLNTSVSYPVNHVYYSDGYIYGAINKTVVPYAGLVVSTDGGSSYTTYTTSAGLGGYNSTGVVVNNGYIFICNSFAGSGGVSKSATIWKRIKTGTAALLEYDPANNSIEEYFAGTGAADSTATLTRATANTIGGVYDYLRRIFHDGSASWASISPEDGGVELLSNAVESGGSYTRKYAKSVFRLKHDADVSDTLALGYAASGSAGSAITWLSLLKFDLVTGFITALRELNTALVFDNGTSNYGVVKTENGGIEILSNAVESGGSYTRKYANTAFRVKHDGTTDKVYFDVATTGAASSAITWFNIFEFDCTDGSMPNFLYFDDGTSHAEIGAENGGYEFRSNAYETAGTYYRKRAATASRLFHNTTTAETGISYAATGAADSAITWSTWAKYDITNDITSIKGNVIQLTQPTQWEAHTFAGYGSTNTFVCYFTTVLTNNINNSDISVTNDSTSGCVVTINTAGVYSVCFTFSSATATGVAAGVTLNVSTPITTGIVSSIGNVRAMEAADAGASINTINMSYTGYFAAAAKLYTHTDGTTPNNTSRCRFSIVKVA